MNRVLTHPQQTHEGGLSPAIWHSYRQALARSASANADVLMLLDTNHGSRNTQSVLRSRATVDGLLANGYRYAVVELPPVYGEVLRAYRNGTPGPDGQPISRERMINILYGVNSYTDQDLFKRLPAHIHQPTEAQLARMGMALEVAVGQRTHEGTRDMLERVTGPAALQAYDAAHAYLQTLPPELRQNIGRQHVENKRAIATSFVDFTDYARERGLRLVFGDVRRQDEKRFGDNLFYDNGFARAVQFARQHEGGPNKVAIIIGAAHHRLQHNESLDQILQRQGLRVHALDVSSDRDFINAIPRRNENLERMASARGHQVTGFDLPDRRFVVATGEIEVPRGNTMVAENGHTAPPPAWVRQAIDRPVYRTWA